jgi:hypothetical protein
MDNRVHGPSVFCRHALEHFSLMKLTGKLTLAAFGLIALGSLCSAFMAGCSDTPSHGKDDVKLNTDPETGLQYADLAEGHGESCAWGDMIKVHYITRLRSGKVVTNTYETGEPLLVKLGAGSVIRGWELGIPGMRVGGKRRLVIPSKLAYRDQERKGIPPNAELTSDIELVEIEPKGYMPSPPPSIRSKGGLIKLPSG